MELGPRVLRHAAVSGACFALYLGIVAGCDNIGLHWAISLALSFPVVAVFGFLLHCRVTWGVPGSRIGFRRYVAGLVSTIPINYFGMFVLHSFAGFPLLSSAVATTLAATGWGFVATRWALIQSRAE
ncbi:MAG: GtrA family protein [Methylocystis sp.]|nr:GtrA family protein [Methylocystis sp.]